MVVPSDKPIARSGPTSIEEIMADPRCDFFSPRSMRHFQTRVSKHVAPDRDRRVTFFITSERGRDAPRRYTLRSFVWATGEVRDVSEFQDYATLRAAKAAMHLFAPSRRHKKRSKVRR